MLRFKMLMVNIHRPQPMRTPLHPFADLLWQLRDLVQHRGTVPVQIYAEK